MNKYKYMDNIISFSTGWALNDEFNAVVNSDILGNANNLRTKLRNMKGLLPKETSAEVVSNLRKEVDNVPDILTDARRRYNFPKLTKNLDMRSAPRRG